jgi:PKD repeat protein
VPAVVQAYRALMGWRRGSLFLVLVSVLLTTAAATGAPTPTHVHFVVAGDFAQGQGADSVLTAMGRSDADLAMTVGDYSYGTTGQEESWCDFAKARVGDGFPFELVAGNHESNGVNGNINDFSACLPNQLPGVVGTYGRQYYVDVPQQDPLVRFVMISPALTFPDGNWQYTAGSPRYNWTVAAIDGARAANIPWVVVGMHKPCITAGGYACDPGTDLTNMLISKKVDLVFNGHEHHYQRSKQLALGAGCAGLAINDYDPDCVADSDNDLVAGAGTVFVTAGTGGQALRDINTSDPELPYFAASSANNINPSKGYSDIDATPDRLLVKFVPAQGTFTDSFTLSRGAPPANTPPTADFTADAHGLTVDFDANPSSDSDGTITSYAWDYGDSTPADSGKAPSHTYDDPGTYPVKLTVTDDDGDTGTVTKQVVVSAVQEIASDAFGRTANNSWGSADKGGPWSVNTANGVSSVGGGRGQVSLAANTASWAYLNQVSTARVDIAFEQFLDKLPVGNGTRAENTVYLRRSSSGTYRGIVRVQPNGSVRVSLARSVPGSSVTTIATEVTVPGLTLAAGDGLQVRGEAVGTSPTTLRLKVWKSGTGEPSGWTVSTTDSTVGIQAAAAIGMAPLLPSGVTNAPIRMTFDDFVATAVP